MLSVSTRGCSAHGDLEITVGARYEDIEGERLDNSRNKETAIKTIHRSVSAPCGILTTAYLCLLESMRFSPASPGSLVSSLKKQSTMNTVPVTMGL